ncbi:MAG: hypothetical protein OEV42_19830 [Deltaproteobacteria bacterium]|nr:hypothetical protein [Deltaproteobacteria bacterium]
MRIFIFFLIIFWTAPSFALEMVVHRPDEAFVSGEDGKIYVYDAEMLAPEEALQLSETFFKWYGIGKYPFIYKIPRIEDYYVVAAIGYQGGKDKGIRFYLIKERNNKRLRRVQTTKGAGDSLMLTPTFYYDDKSVIILAEVGAESSWGFSVFRFDPERGYLYWMGMINVAEPAERFNEMTSPIEVTRVFVDNSEKKPTYTVEISGDIVLNPGSKDQKTYHYKGESFKFVSKGKRFIFQEPGVKKEN